MFRGKIVLRSIVAAALCGAVAGFLAIAPAAADGPTKSDSPKAAQLPAVDGINGSVTGIGGVADSRGLLGAAGSITLPVGHRFGLQIDGGVLNTGTGSGNDVTTAGVGGHFFWRDPSIGLVGVYGHYWHVNAVGGVNLFAGAAEGALYLGRFTVEAVLGAQGGNAERAGATVSTRFFDVVQFSYYPTENLKLSIGHSYVLDTNSAVFGVEWGVSTGRGTMAALIVRGGISGNGDGAIYAGIRLYIGGRDKPLIRRHREDDPIQFIPDTLAIVTVSSSFPNAPPGDYGFDPH